MPLTDTAIRNLKPSGTARRVFDERGLYLEVAPSGGRWWRLKYRIAGKEKRLSLGVYPDVGLQDARARREEARQQIAKGIDPSAHRRAEKLANAEAGANSFERITREWFAKYSPNWAPGHSSRIIRLFERDIFPYIGESPISTITAPELLATIRRIESRVIETAHRALGNCGQVFRYAIATGRAQRDPSADLRGALATVKGEHFAATTDPKRLGSILRAMDGYEGTPIVSCALRLAPLLFVRPGELRAAEWAHIDFTKREWSYTVTKTKIAHIVPLCNEALAILHELRPLTGTGRFVFPSARSSARPMSDNAILAAMRRMDIGKDEMTGHGFRAVARTILDEVMGFRPDVIEHQLAHAVRDPNGRAYNRTAHLIERHRMMQAWADHLHTLKDAQELLPFRKTA